MILVLKYVSKKVSWQVHAHLACIYSPPTIPGKHLEGMYVVLFFSLVLQNVMNIFASVAAYKYLIRWRKAFQTGWT